MARRGRNIFFPICFLVANFAVCAWAQQSSPSAALVPRLIKFSGVVGDGQVQSGSGVIGITFAMYAEAQGGAPLWMEVQNIQLDGNGHYTALLGASKAEASKAEGVTGVIAILQQYSISDSYPRLFLLPEHP